MFKHILIPLDGSLRAEQAIPMALRLAKASGASILLLEVVNTPTHLGLYSEKVRSSLHHLHEKRLVAATTYLSQLAHSLEEENIEIHIAVLPGPPAQTILDVASEQEIDLIVMCSHGHTGLPRWTLGNISQKVIRQSTIPVLLFREQSPKASAKTIHSFRATVALDGSPFAEATLLPAAQIVTALNAPGEGELHLLQLIEVPEFEEEFGYIQDSDFNLLHAVRQEAGYYLQNAYTRLLRISPGLAHLCISWSVEECKDVADALIQITESGKGSGTHKTSQLIVLATHGRNGLSRLLLGSVTERVLHGSTLSLLIVHPSTTRALADFGRK